jgi:ABC-type dipeptide/oligopeptide/nickel transport system ATPase component
VTGSIVSVRDLAVAYRTRRGAIPALRGISLDVASGESYGLVG